MTSPSSGVQSSQSSATTATDAAQTDVAANGGAPANGSGNVSMDTKISSVGDLRERAPKVYDAMLVGIATTICNQSKRRQDQIKRMMREGNG